MFWDNIGSGGRLPALCICVVMFSGCALLPPTTAVALPAPVHREQGPGERITRNADGQITARVEYWIDAEGNETRHGVEASFWPSGQVKAHREFDHGNPTGHWQTYWIDGMPRSDHAIVPGQGTTMLYYHPNGLPAAEGQAIAGKRTGPWVYWFDTGAVTEKGSYVDGKRDGLWQAFDRAGSPEQPVRYAAGKRIAQ